MQPPALYLPVGHVLMLAHVLHVYPLVAPLQVPARYCPGGQLVLAHRLQVTPLLPKASVQLPVL